MKKKLVVQVQKVKNNLSIEEPFYGNLYSRFYDVDIDELSSKKFNKPFIEPEIALRIKKDIDISKAPFSLRDIDTLFDGFVCALEIVDFRFNKSLKEIGALNLIATNGASEYWIRNSEIFDLIQLTLIIIQLIFFLIIILLEKVTQILLWKALSILHYG